MIVWPSALVNCAVFNTLHSQNYDGVGSHRGLSRARFFVYAFIAAAVWCRYSEPAAWCNNHISVGRYYPGLLISGVEVSGDPSRIALSYHEGSISSLFNWVCWIAPDNVVSCCEPFSTVQRIHCGAFSKGDQSAVWVRQSFTQGPWSSDNVLQIQEWPGIFYANVRLECDSIHRKPVTVTVSVCRKTSHDTDW